MGNIFYSGTYINSYFQGYDTGNTGGVKANTTNIQSGGNDINKSLSPRDNNPANAAVAKGAILANGKDIALLFNKTGATINVTIGGTAVYTGSVINTGITYSGQLPSGNDPIYSPTFIVPNPTVDTTSAIKTTCTAIGAYGTPFTTVSSQSPPNTTYYTITSTPVAGGVLALRLPGNYAPGTISGAFSIVPSGTLVRPSTFVASLVAGTGPAEWVSSVGAIPPESSITDINYGDTTTYSYVDSGTDLVNYTVRGTISFISQSYTSATLYIQYGVNSFPWLGPAPVSISTGSLEYSTNGGSSYTTAFTWSTSTNPDGVPPISYILVLPASSNLNQIFIRITSKQTLAPSAPSHISTLLPTIYDMYISYT
jgi:hypothetical protein